MRFDERRRADLLVASLVLVTVGFSSGPQWLAAVSQAPAASAPNVKTFARNATPMRVSAVAMSPWRVRVSWTPAPDETPPIGYAVYRNGLLLATIGNVTSFVDVTAEPASLYSYGVRARRAADDWSGFSEPAAVSTPAGNTGASVFADGFELGSFANWTAKGAAANWTFESTRVHAGKFAAQASTSAGAAYAKKVLPRSYPNGYFRAYIYLASAVGQVNLLRYRSADDHSLAYLYVTTNGLLGLRNDARNVTLKSTTALTFDAWHRIEFHLEINGHTGASEVWLDGAKVAALSLAGDWGTTPIGIIQIGEVHAASSWNVTYDDVAFGTTSTGP